MAHQKEAEEFTHLLTLWIELNEKIQKATDHRRQIEKRIGEILKLVSVVQDERRIHLRIPCKIPAKAKPADTTTEIRGEVKDIGLGGLFFQTEAKVLVGEELEITLQAHKQASLVLQAQVVWRKAIKPKGVGVIFKGNSGLQENSLLLFIIGILKELYEQKGSLPLS